MLNVEFIRNNKEKVLTALKNKKRKADLDELLRLDDKRKKILLQSQKLREERNIHSKKPFTEEVKTKGKQIKEELKAVEGQLASLDTKIHTIVSFIPNVPLDEVPVGEDASGNVLLRKWGTPPQFTFKPKSHIELGTSLDIIDLERGVKISGFRGYFLKNRAAVLQIALMFYVFQKLVKKGYTPFIAPSIVKGFTLFGAAQFPWGEPEVYKLNDEDAFLSGTAEVPITAYYCDEILKEEDLPKKSVAFSPCFRREIGSYGKDTKGLYRVHEFWKIEQVILDINDLENAKKIHEELQQNAEEILQELGLPYQVLLMCTGDMGEPQLKKYDIETWMPSRNGYGETMSNSIMGDFQTRRLNIKYRKKDGTKEFCFSFNNTALASPRILVAILENYQQEDGSIKIPEVLQKLTGFDTIPLAK